MDKYISEIKYMLEIKTVDANRIRHVVRKLFNSIRVPAFIIPENGRFIRVRINESSDFFNNVSELSYPPKEYATLQRASLANKPLLYASIFTTSADPTNPNMPRITTLLETYPDAFNLNANESKLCTYSVWSSSKELMLFPFPVNIKQYERPCKEAFDINSLWAEVNNTPQNADKSDFLFFISELISLKKNDSLYEILATITDEILELNKDYLDGVIYPSVQIGGDGLNIALKSEVVDNYVKCDGAMVCQIINVQKTITVENLWRAELHDDDTINYHKIDGH